MDAKDGHGETAALLAGHRIVLSGVFKEEGGGEGLNLGKQRMKKKIELHGGAVTSSISKKTTLLLVGDAPGMRKVQQANSRGVSVLDRVGLGLLLKGTHIKSVPQPHIGEYSDGFDGGGKKNSASPGAVDTLTALIAAARHPS